MSKSKKEKFERLAKIYEEELEDDDPGWEDTQKLNLVELRDGKTYSSEPTQKVKEVKIKMAGDTDPKPGTSSGGQGTGAQNPPLRILPNPARVAPYTATDPNYPVRKFLDAAEDVMRTSYVERDLDKISFVRSQIATGSLAHSLLESCTLRAPAKAGNYQEFRRVLLETFEDYTRTSAVKGINSICGKLSDTSGAKNRLEALIPASLLSEDLIRVLSDGGWFENESITRQQLEKFMQLFFYINSLNPTERKSTLTLDFKPVDNLHDFTKKVKAKIEEKGEDPKYIISKINNSPSTNTSTTNAEVTSLVAPMNVIKTPPHDKPNQRSKTRYDANQSVTSPNPIPSRNTFNSSKPWQPRNEGAKPRTFFGSNNNKGGNFTSFTSHQPYKAYGSSVNNTNTRKYCFYHDSPSHSTEECYTIKQLKSNRSRLSQESVKPQGEDPRVIQKPTG